MTATTPGSRPAAGALVAIGVGVLLLVALVVAAIVVTPILLATPPRATLTVTVAGPDGSLVDETGDRMPRPCWPDDSTPPTSRTR